MREPQRELGGAEHGQPRLGPVSAVLRNRPRIHDGQLVSSGVSNLYGHWWEGANVALYTKNRNLMSLNACYTLINYRLSVVRLLHPERL